MAIQFVGLPELRAAFKAAPEKIRADFAPVVNLRSQKIRLTAQQTCPKVTGALRDSIKVTSHGMAARILTGVPYARFVEFGTDRSQAHAFMRPAAETHRDPWIRDVQNFGKIIERDLTSGGGLL